MNEIAGVRYSSMFSHRSWVVVAYLVASACGGSGGKGTAGQVSNLGGAPPIAESGGSGGAIDDSGTADADANPPLPAHVCAKAQLDTTTTTSFYAAAQCLFEGADAPQQDVAKGTIDAERVAILRGRVTDNAGTGLQDVRVTVLRHKEFGDTLTDALGEYALAVNGGENLTLSFKKEGRLPVQRQRRVDWLRFAVYPDVAMLAESSTATAVDLTAATAPTLAVAPTVKDDSGTRAQAVLIRPATKVTLDLPDGTTQQLTQFHLRSTEYTVGNAGPSAMPGDLPNTSGYTYASEFSLDEARAVGATRVSFDPPVISYVDNFLKFPAGTVVPAGYYDSTQATWVPGDNGMVLNIVTVSAGVATVDVTGDGVADDQATLTSLGIDSSELATLGAKYNPGVSLWRVPLAHFSPWDFNWGFGPPADAEIPNNVVTSSSTQDNPQTTCGSIIGCENQTLGESVAILGTPITLYYQSERMPGRRDSHALTIQLSGSTLPESVKSILLEVEVLGKVTQKTYAAAPNLSDEFDWDGTDAWGRAWQGRQLATVSVGYVYDGSYQRTSRFGSPPTGAAITGDRSRQQVTLWRKWEGYVGSLNAGTMGLGGWTIDVQHLYDPRSHVLYLGNGQKRSADSIGTSITTVIGTGSDGYSGDNGPAVSAKITQPHGVVVGPDGTIYVSDDYNDVVRKVTSDGVITTIAGTGASGYGGDGGPASAAFLNSPMGLALGPDGTLYVADNGNYRVRAISPDGNIRTVAGGGTKTPSASKPVAAAETYIGGPHSLSLTGDGTLYVADEDSNCIYAISPDAKVTLVAGGGTSTDDGANGTETRIRSPLGIAVSTTGELYYTEWNGNRVRRVDGSGRVWTIAGTGTSGFSGDGGPATLAKLSSPHTVELGPEGSVFITDEGNRRVRRVRPDGYIETIAGTGSSSSSATLGDNGPPLKASFTLPRVVYRHKDGSLWIADYDDARVRLLSPSLPGYSADNTVLAASDASELYVFDTLGRHLRTVDPVTQATVWNFTYDTNHRLTTISDRNNNQTTITYDANGVASSITGPFGATTSLSLLSSGYLGSIVDPLSRKTSFTYLEGGGADGLLKTFTDARNNVHSFQYDDLGRLVRDENPAGGFKQLARTEITDGYSVSVTTALGRATVHEVQNPSDGSEKRTLTSPDGVSFVTTKSADGSETTVSPDGTTSTTTYGPDPRFGMVAPTSSVTTKTPGGITSTVTESRSASITNTQQPLSATSLTNTVTVNGRAYKSTYTASAKTWTVTTPASRQSTTLLDDLGRVSQLQQPGVAAVSYGYDSAGRVTSIAQGARISTITYDANGYPQTMVDPLGRTVQLTRDAIGRLLSETLPGGRTVAFGYDASDNVSLVTPPGRTAHAFQYSSMDRLTSYTPPAASGTDLLATSYTYDLDGAPSNVLLPDETTIVPSYDAAGRVSSVTTACGVMQFTYDSAGRIATVTAPTGDASLAYTYDGSLILSEDTSGPISGGVSWKYDSDYRVSSASVNGSSVSFKYDNNNLLTAAGSLTISRETATGRVSGTSLYNLVTSSAYDDTYGELVTFDASASRTSVYSYTLTRDIGGRITGKTETIQGVATEYSYTYDDAGRLATVTKGGEQVASYTYDSNGNRLSRVANGVTESGTYDDQDRMLSYGGASFTYKPNGELASWAVNGQTTKYDYDAIGNLRGVALPDGSQIDYVIDGKNRRVGKKVNGALVEGFLYEGQLRPVVWLDAAGKVRARFVYGLHVNVPEYMVTADGTPYRFITDHLGSPRLVVNASTGAVAEQIDYDEWGRVLSDSNPGLQPFGFAGGIYDRDTGLVRFGLRDYDPVVGKWTTKDSLGFGGSLNFYLFCGGDPVNLTDPSGQMPFLVVTGLIGLVGGAAYGAISSARSSEGFSWEAVAKWGVIGGVAGVTLGVGTSLLLTGTVAATTTQVGAAGAALVGMGSMAASEGEGPIVRLFHGGVLRGGAVQSGQFCASTVAQHAQEYADKAGGAVYAFDVPAKWLMQMEASRAAQRGMDMFQDSMAPEWRFYGDAAARLNDFLAH